MTSDSPNPFESPGSAKAEDSPPPARRGRLTPPMFVWLIAASFVLIAAAFRWFNIGGDNAVVNIVTFLCGVLSCLTLGTWFLFFSGYLRIIRFGSAVTVVVLLLLLGSVLRVDRVSGELVPEFRPRWAKKTDETLQPATPAQTDVKADLATVTSDDFPQFLGPQRNNRVDHVKLSRDWSKAPRKLWKQPIGAGWSAFAAVNGFAVTLEQRGPEELVTCYEIETGKLVWAHSTKTRHETVPGGTGPRSTPTIHAGRVYALGATGQLVCLDGATGKPAWQTNLLERYHVEPGTDENGVAWGRSNSPLVVNDLVIVPAGGPAEGRRVSLAAFHRESGELVWEGGDQQVSYSSPIVATVAGVRQVVCVLEKSVAGHDLKTGKRLWSYDWPGESTGKANVSQPVPVGENQLFLSKAYGVGSALITLSSEAPDQWSVETQWANVSLLKTKFTNVVLYQGNIYGLSDGIMECVDAATGKRQWKDRRGTYGQGQILGVGDVILVQAESGEVVMISATPEGFHELGRFQAIEGITWNNLCLAGYQLLVRNSEEAACYELP